MTAIRLAARPAPGPLFSSRAAGLAIMVRWAARISGSRLPHRLRGELFAGLFYCRAAVRQPGHGPGRQPCRARTAAGDGAQAVSLSGLLMVPALALGLWLWLGYRVGSGSGWMHVKLALVLGVIGYHHACRTLLRGFEQSAKPPQPPWYRRVQRSVRAAVRRTVCWWSSSRSSCRCPPSASQLGHAAGAGVCGAGALRQPVSLSGWRWARREDPVDDGRARLAAMAPRLRPLVQPAGLPAAGRAAADCARRSGVRMASALALAVAAPAVLSYATEVLQHFVPADTPRSRTWR